MPGGATAVAAAVGDGGVDRPHRTRYRSQTRSCRLCSHTCNTGTVHILYTHLKKRKSNFPHISGIQIGAVAKSYMRKSFLIYEEMRKYFPIDEEAVSHL